MVLIQKSYLALHPSRNSGTGVVPMPGKGKVSTSGLDLVILIEDENVIMGDGDDTLEQAPAPSVLKEEGGNDAVPGVTMIPMMRKGAPVISMMLVHGDAVVLSGDEFEYSIKCTGTSITARIRCCVVVGVNEGSQTLVFSQRSHIMLSILHSNGY